MNSPRDNFSRHLAGPMIDSLDSILMIAVEPCVWIHVTSMMNWNAPPVGIIRVEREYCKWALEKAAHTKIRFCRYDSTFGIFVEVPLEVVRAKIDNGRSASQSDEAHSGGRVKAWLRQFVLRLPVPLARVMRTVVSFALKLVRRCFHPVARWLGRHCLSEAPFSPGDFWVSLGPDWVQLDQPNFLKLKQRVGLRVTSICYDVIPARCASFVLQPREGFATYIRMLTRYSDAVLCISEHAQSDFAAFVRELGETAPPTAVVRLGADLPGRLSKGGPPGKLRIDADARPFVLYVSTIEKRKNHKILYDAWANLRERGVVPPRLIFVGKESLGARDLLAQIAGDSRVKEDIQALTSVSDEELDWLYRNAAFTVYPSLYEGWGLPVVESLAYGKLCIASDRTSLPEAGGRWCEYLDPYDVCSWAERIAYFTTNPDATARRNAEIMRSFTPPAWSDTAKEIHNVVISAGK